MINEKTIITLVIIGLILLILQWIVHPKPKVKPRLIITIFYNNKNFYFMPLTSLTLTDRLPKILLLSVIDENNNDTKIPGTLSNITPGVPDTSQDTTSLSDAAIAAISVQAVSGVGGTTLTVTADFASDAKNLDGSPELSLPGLPLSLSLINNIPVKAALVADLQA